MIFSNFIKQSALPFLFLGVVLSAGCAKKDTRVGSSTGSTFYVDTIAGSFTADGLNSNDVVTRKFSNITACIKDNALQAAVMNIEFSISAGATSFTKKTDERGCIVWQELISYDPFENERQILMTRTITALQGHSGSEVIQLAYNPWAGDKLLFLKREAARGPENSLINYSSGGEIVRKNTVSGDSYSVRVDLTTSVVSQNLKKSYISAMSMQFLKRDYANYEINSNLNLILAHQYRLKFTSALIRKTLDQGTVPQVITAGQFKFYFVLLREGYDAPGVNASNILNYVVSANEFTSSALVGRFISDVTLKFSNVAALASRLTGVLTVLSVDRPDVFAESSFEGVLSPISGGGGQGIDLIPSGLNARDLFEKNRIAESKKVQTSGVAFFAKYSNFVPMTSDAVNMTVPKVRRVQTQTETFDVLGALNRIKSKQALSSQEEHTFASAFCFKYFDKTVTHAAAYAECIKNPKAMMKFVVRDLVEKVNSPTPRALGKLPVETLSFMSGVTFTESTSTSRGQSSSNKRSVGAEMGGNLGIGFSLPFFGSGTSGTGGLGFSMSAGAKISTGKEWYDTVGIQTSSGETTSLSASQAHHIMSDGYKFALDLTTRSCLLIFPTPELKKVLGSTAYPAGKYLCSQTVESGTREETYYFLNETNGLATSPLSDNLSAEDNPWRMFIRGTSTYGLFTQLFAQKQIKLVLRKLPQEEASSIFNDFYITQEFPGMLMPN